MVDEGFTHHFHNPFVFVISYSMSIDAFWITLNCVVSVFIKCFSKEEWQGFNYLTCHTDSCQKFESLTNPYMKIHSSLFVPDSTKRMDVIKTKAKVFISCCRL